MLGVAEDVARSCPAAALGDTHAYRERTNERRPTAWNDDPVTDDETPAAPAETHHEPQFTPSAEFNVAEGRRDVGLCFVGSSMTAGYGEPKGLGWVGHVSEPAQHPDLDLTAYNLGVRSDTSAGVMARWRSETALRWVNRTERRLVVSVGANDIATGVSLARSRLNLANILDEATTSGIAVFCVGLTPASRPSGTPALRRSPRRRPTSAPAAGWPTSTASSPWSATSSGSRTSTRRPTGSTPDRRGTASSPGWSSTTAGTTGCASPPSHPTKFSASLRYFAGTRTRAASRAYAI